MAEDFLQVMLDESTQNNPDFPALYESARARRALLHDLAAARQDKALSQTKAAAFMGTSQSAVARIEAGDADPKFSTVERLAAALGYHIEHTLVPIAATMPSKSAAAPSRATTPKRSAKPKRAKQVA